MTESFENSVSIWIEKLKQGDDDAARNLWERYFQKLVKVGGNVLQGAHRRVTDGEDVAISAFQSLCEGAAEGRFDQLSGRDELWRLMVAITSLKAKEHIRRNLAKKRGGGEVRGHSVVLRNDGPADDMGGFEQFIGMEPTPEFISILDEEHERLLAALRDDTQRQIATLRLQGFANEEIAERLGVALRTVERKLNRIRETWARELSP